MNNPRLEIHTHSYVAGINSNCGRQLVHSHEGGDSPHQHQDTGPASYTIDKDEWAAATGLRGGGRKKFSKTPNGEQLPNMDLEEWQTKFDVIVCKTPAEFKGNGPGIAPAIRLMKSFRIRAQVRA